MKSGFEEKMYGTDAGGYEQRYKEDEITVSPNKSKGVVDCDIFFEGHDEMMKYINLIKNRKHKFYTSVISKRYRQNSLS